MLSNQRILIKGRFLLPAHGTGWVRVTIEIVALPKKFLGAAQGGGQKEWGLGERIFAHLLLRVEGATGVGNNGGAQPLGVSSALRSPVSQDSVRSRF